MRSFRDEIPTETVKAVVAVLDGVPAAIGGLHYDGGVKIFFVILPEFMRYKVSIWRGAQFFKQHMAVPGALALADPDIPGSDRFIRRLGMIPVSETKNGTVYQWPSS